MKRTNPDVALPLRALRRAGKNALKLAQQTGTPCVVWRDGKIVNINVITAKKS